MKQKLAIACSMSLTISATFLIALAFQVPEVLCQNLLVNGGFEEGPSVGGGNQPLNAGSTEIPGWTVTRGQIDYTFRDWSACEGNISIDLEGSPGNGGIEQGFLTIPNGEYDVSFCFAGNPCLFGSERIKKMRVSAADQSKDFNFDTAGHTYPDIGWITETWNFIARDSSTTIEFYSLGSGGLCGPAIDKVFVTLLPRFKRGDSDANGIIDITDAITTFVFLFFGQGEILCEDGADTNDNGVVDISDGILTLTYKFLGGVTIPEPGPSQCGGDPTQDKLECNFSLNCS